MAFQNPDEQKIQQYLKTAKNIAVVGLSDNTERTSYQITKIVQDYGYNIFPVNPKLAGQEVLGRKVYARLQDVPEPIDIVDIFRRSEFLPEVADDFLETDAKVFWAQLGIENEEAAKKLQDAGRNDIVMDRCVKIELGKLNQK
ncbi:MAG: CoA-binding protein [Tetragenococcus sp.]|nr:CoA-binding protein [Tetragenococcus sp.]